MMPYSIRYPLDTQRKYIVYTPAVDPKQHEAMYYSVGLNIIGQLS
jgi:hypothetical protein